jgi:hypothetical protein
MSLKGCGGDDGGRDDGGRSPTGDEGAEDAGSSSRLRFGREGLAGDEDMLEGSERALATRRGRPADGGEGLKAEER